MNTEIKEIINDIKNKRHDTLQDAKKALEEAFTPIYKRMFNEKMIEEERIITLPCQKKDENITPEESGDVSNELKSPINQDIKKKSSFIDNFIFSLYRKRHNDEFGMKHRFQILSNIKTDPAVAKLKLKDNIVVNLTEIPHWYDIIRYKVCGFEYEITKFK